MEEKDIAENMVIPYLERLGWPKQLITRYGRVPVRMGRDTKWADMVTLFVDENDVAAPYLVIEIKPKLTDLSDVLAQTDSYSKFLDAPYLVVTDGVTYYYYQRKMIGDPIKISNVPVPDKKHLTVTQSTRFRTGFLLCEKPKIKEAESTGQYKDLSDKIDRFLGLMAEGNYYLGVNENYTLRNDAIWHCLSTRRLHNLIHKNGVLRPNEFKKCFEDNIMCGRPANQNRIYSKVDNDFEHVKAFLRFLKEFKGDPEENLDRLFNPNDELHISGMGPFMVSQFLAGAHPHDYAVIEDRMVRTMKDLGLIDTEVKSDTPKGYLYINDICKKLYSGVFEEKFRKNQSRLGFKVDKDFGLALIHDFFWEYEEFQSYNVSDLGKATGTLKKQEEKITQERLEELAQAGA